MICSTCAKVADSDHGDGTEGIIEIGKDGTKFKSSFFNHCNDPGCTCQHKPRGSWAGSISTN